MPIHPSHRTQPSLALVPRINSEADLLTLLDSLDTHLDSCTPGRAHRLILSAVRRAEADLRPDTPLSVLARESLTNFISWVSANFELLSQNIIDPETEKKLWSLQRKLDTGRWAASR